MVYSSEACNYICVWSKVGYFRVTMNEKDTIITWNEAAELFTSNHEDLEATRQSADKFEALIAANPHHSVSKLCYNAALLRKILGDNQTALKVRK